MGRGFSEKSGRGPGAGEDGKRFPRGCRERTYSLLFTWITRVGVVSLVG